MPSEMLLKSLRLCAVTDRHWIMGKEWTLEGQVEEAIMGGTTMVQIREKHLPQDEFIRLARALHQVTARHGVPLIVNDSLKVALAAEAEGLHIGQDDGDIVSIREALGKESILGVSAHTVEEAVLAEKAGADYLGLGAVFPTGSKDDVDRMSFETVRAICASVSIPCIAIGGITAQNARQLRGLGLKGIAAISAVFADPAHVREAASKLASIKL